MDFTDDFVHLVLFNDFWHAFTYSFVYLVLLTYFRHGFTEGSGSQSPVPEKKKPHIKKPLNAFMLFMKEQRAKVVAECTLKESAAINQILGRRVSFSVLIFHIFLDQAFKMG